MELLRGILDNALTSSEDTPSWDELVGVLETELVANVPDNAFSLLGPALLADTVAHILLNVYQRNNLFEHPNTTIAELCDDLETVKYDLEKALSKIIWSLRGF